MFHVTSYPHISYVRARFLLCNTLWVIKNRTWWCNTSSTWGSPDTCSAAASSIPVTRPGHDFDCAQAPMRLVACTGASIVTCSRLVVSEIWDWTWTGGVARLVAAHADPASDWRHGRQLEQLEWTWPGWNASGSYDGDSKDGDTDHSYDTCDGAWQVHVCLRI